jgi:hypothetical protein
VVVATNLVDETRMSDTALRSVELTLMIFEPDTFFPKYLRSVDDVAINRSILRRCTYTDAAIKRLMTLVWDRVSQHKRKNLLYGLQAIKWLLQNRLEQSRDLSQLTTDGLFDVYKHFVFDPLEEIRWCVSAILKDKPLRSHQVQWLLDNVDASEHILNRLLRYPNFDSLIADWARTAIQKPELEKRRAELLGRLIANDLPPEAEYLPSAAILWGIYYSSANTETKHNLIIRCASDDNMDEALEICMRCGLVTTLRELRSKIGSNKPLLGTS